MKEHGLLSTFKVKISKDSPLQAVATAEDVLAYLFFLTPEERLQHKSSTKGRWLGSRACPHFLFV